MTDTGMMNLYAVSTFRCRKCRIRLFSSDHLQSHVFEDQKLRQNVDLGDQEVISSCGKCSSWFLRDENMLPWVTDSVEEVC